MKTSFRKLMAMALVLIMVVSALPVSAMAEYGAEAAKSVPGIMDKVWEGWRDQWLGQLAGRISGRPAQKMQAEAVDGAYVKIDAPNLALPAGTEVRVVKLDDEGMDKVQAIIGNTPGANVKAISAYDITFFCNGKEIEPNGSVSVDMSLLGIEEGKAASIYHIDASAAELNSDMTCEKVENAEVSGSTVSFRANSFSIYFVADSTGTPKVKVNFEDGEGNVISTQRVSLADFDDYDGMPIYEPSVDNAEGTFTGWQIDGNGDAMLITDVNKYVKDNFTYIFETENSEITFTPTDVTLFFIIYMSGPADDANTKAISTMPYVVNNEKVTFKVNDTFQKAGVRLQAWNGDDGEIYTPGNTVALNMSSFNTDELILYPVYIEGHWLIFDTNEDANDTANHFTPWADYDSSRYEKPEDDPNVETSRAKLIAPVFVPNGKKISEITMPIVFRPGDQYTVFHQGDQYAPTGDASDYYLEPGSKAYDYYDVYRRGYDFGGWYTDSSMNTALNTNAELSKDTTVYAKWNPGKTTVRIYLFKETYDSPTYGNPNAVPEFAYHSMLVGNKHLNERYTPVSYPEPPDDRSAYREYTWGAELKSADPFSLRFDTITYCRTHDEKGRNPIPNFADYEFEYFYFEPSDTRYTSRQINSVTHLRGDGTSTLEFYLRRCAYEVEIYVPRSEGVGDVTSIDDNHIYLGPRRGGGSDYEVIERRGNTWYYMGSNDVCYNPQQVNPVNYTRIDSNLKREKLILRYFGLYYKTLDNYLTIPTNMCGKPYGVPTRLIPFPQFFELKAAAYEQDVYSPSAYPNTQGYAPTKTYRFVFSYYNASAAAIVRMKESAENHGAYTFSDMMYWLADSDFDFGHDNLRGFFASYVDVYTNVVPSNWQDIMNNPSNYNTNLAKRVVLSDYSPNDLWEIFEDQALDWLMYDYPDDPNWSNYNANNKSTKDALIEYFRGEYPNHEVWTQYTLEKSPEVREIYDFFRSYYPNEPLWNGPQTARSHTSTGGFIITYKNGEEDTVTYTTNENEYRYVNTGANATSTDGTVLLIHEARRSYPLTYTSLDSAAFGIEADDTWVAYGITASQENDFRPFQGFAYRSNPKFEPEGKSFDGWYADKSLTDPYDGDDPFGAYGQLVYAKYVPAKYRVVVHYGSEEYPNMQFPNGTPNSTLVVKHGDLLDASLANAAMLEGYSIVEWVDEDGSPFKFDSTKIGPNIADTENYDGSNKMGVDEFGRAYDDTEASDVKGIVHIYARWGLDEFNAESIKIVYDAIYGEGNINGSFIVPDAHVYADGSIAFGRPAATAEGDDMHFAYWELHKPDGSTARVYPGQRFVVDKDDRVPYQPGYDMTWSYKAADGSPLTATNKCLPGQHPTAPAGVPEGYVENGHYYAFQGWTPDPQNTIPVGAMTFTARYGAAQDIPEVTITLDYQPVQSDTTATAAYGSTYTVPDVTLADDSPYYFLGWSKTADGNAAYNANDSVTIDSTSGFTLYAVWASRIIYKDGYSSSAGTPMADVITYTDYQATSFAPGGVTELNWEHSGYAFVGWAYSGTTVQPGDTINSPTYPITLTAQWLDGYTVTYNNNGGSGSIESVIVPVGGQLEVVSESTARAAFTRTGYTLTGFNSAANGSGTAYTFGGTYSISANTTLYAVWQDAKYIPYTGTNFDSNKKYAIGYVSNGKIYLLTSAVNSNPLTLEVTYNSSGTVITDETALWSLSGSRTSFTARSFNNQNGYIKRIKGQGTVYVNGKQSEAATMKFSDNYVQFTNPNDSWHLVLSSNLSYYFAKQNSRTHAMIILEQQTSTSGNVLPAPESKLSAATKSEKAVKGNVAAPVVDTRKAAPTVATRGDVTVEAGENVIYLTAVYVERADENGESHIVFNANGLTFAGDAVSIIDNVNTDLNLAWTPGENSIGEYIASEEIAYNEKGEATLMIPGPQVFEQYEQPGYRLIGWNTQPDGSGVEILFSNITAAEGQYDAKFATGENALRVYVDNLDKNENGKLNTRINTLYAMWEGYTAFYHSANGTIVPNSNSAKVKFGGNTVGGTLIYSTYYNNDDLKVCIPNMVRAKYLYGGYYKNYPGKGVNYADSGANFGQDDPNVKGYGIALVQDSSKLVEWNKDDAITKRGDEFTVSRSEIADYIGHTLYIKEVPDSRYLRPYTAYTYDKSLKERWEEVENPDLSKMTSTNGYLVGIKSGNDVYLLVDGGSATLSLAKADFYGEYVIGTSGVFNSRKWVVESDANGSYLKGKKTGKYILEQDGKVTQSSTTDKTALSLYNSLLYTEDGYYLVTGGKKNRVVESNKTAPENCQVVFYQYYDSITPIRSLWLVTDTDDTNYEQAGFIVDVDPITGALKEDSVFMRSKYMTDGFVLSASNGISGGGNGNTTVNNTTFSNNRSYTPYVGYLESASNPGVFGLEGKAYINYWITPDSILVTGKRARIFGDCLYDVGTIGSKISAKDVGVAWSYIDPSDVPAEPEQDHN